MKSSLISRLILITLLSSLSSFTFAEPQNSSLLKNEIRHYHDSGQYEKELTQQIQKAEKFLLEQVHYYKAHRSNKKLALVLDIDETSLTNYDKIAQRDFAADGAQIHQEILAADSPVIKPMLDLYQTALKNKVKVFFVTGRTSTELDATKQNLAQAGYKDWAEIYVRPTKYKKPSIISFKANTRKKIEEKGYIVIASIGDQYSDIKGGHALKGFKLPNPFYHIP